MAVISVDFPPMEIDSETNLPKLPAGYLWIITESEYVRSNIVVNLIEVKYGRTWYGRRTDEHEEICSQRVRLTPSDEDNRAEILSSAKGLYNYAVSRRVDHLAWKEQQERRQAIAKAREEELQAIKNKFIGVYPPKKL